MSISIIGAELELLNIENFLKMKSRNSTLIRDIEIGFSYSCSASYFLQEKIIFNGPGSNVAVLNQHHVLLLSH